MTGQDLIAAFRKQPLGFTCALLAVGFFLGWYFRFTSVSDREVLFQEKTAQGERVLANLKNALRLEEQATAAAGLVNTLEERLLRVGDPAANLQVFYRYEAESGTKLLEVRPTSTVAVAPPPGARKIPVKGAAAKVSYKPIGFTLTVIGTYEQLLAFLTRLETGGHYCRFLAASLTTGVAQQDLLPQDGQLRLTLSLNVELLGES